PLIPDRCFRILRAILFDPSDVKRLVMDANDRIACLLSSAAKRYPPVAFAVRRDGGEPGCQHASFALALVPGDDKPVGAPHQVRLESEAGSVADLDRRSA